MRIKRFSWLAEFSLRGSFISFVALTRPNVPCLPHPTVAHETKSPRSSWKPVSLNGSVNVREAEVLVAV